MTTQLRPTLRWRAEKAVLVFALLLTLAWFRSVHIMDYASISYFEFASWPHNASASAWRTPEAIPRAYSDAPRELFGGPQFLPRVKMERDRITLVIPYWTLIAAALGAVALPRYWHARRQRRGFAIESDAKQAS